MAHLKSDFTISNPNQRSNRHKSARKITLFKRPECALLAGNIVIEYFWDENGVVVQALPMGQE
jgi:hypothetical protein